MEGQVYLQNDLKTQACKQTGTGHSGHRGKQGLYSYVNLPDAFKTKQNFVLSFDNPAHRRT